MIQSLRRLAPFTPVVVLILVAAASVILLIGLRQKQDQSLRSFVILVDGVHQARNKVTHALLMHEKGRSDLETIDRQIVLRHIDEALERLAELVAGQSSFTAFEGAPVLDTLLLHAFGAYAQSIEHARLFLRAGQGSLDLGAERQALFDADQSADYLLQLVNTALSQATRENEKAFLVTVVLWLLVLVASSSGTYIMVLRRLRSDRRLRLQAHLLDNSNDAILATDQEGRIVNWNKGAERLYGWTEDQARGQTLKELLKPNYPNAENSHPDITVRERGYWWGEVQHERKDGSILPVETSITQLSGSGDHLNVTIMINRDVSERKRFEEQIQRIARLESLGALSGGIVHDLNNILSPVILGVELIRTSVADQKIHLTLDMMGRSLDRGRQIAKQVLAIARGDEDGNRTLSLKLVLKEVQEFTTATFPRSIRITLVYPSSVRNVRGDVTKLGQVFMNLFVNARDAMPGGGSIRVEARNVTLDEAAAARYEGAMVGDYVCVSVSDTGVGIPKESQAKVFERFYTTKPIGKGTGLGLSLVRQIVSEHAGFVTLESEPGSGTSFFVYLKSTTDAKEGFRTVVEENAPPQMGATVLIVEDETYLRSITAEILKTYGLHVVQASNGVEALTMYDAHDQRIDLVMTDMDMPEMDGKTLIRELRSRAPSIAVIVTSGSSESEAFDPLVEFLPKPYSTTQLLRSVNECLTPRQ